MTLIETDYLVVGAGAAGMAFTDSLIANSDADVVMVDRRYGPGGHWNDAYPFVRLHQPSAFYGVSSSVLGSESIDEVGPNAGFYDRATAAQICDYYQRVMDDLLLASGRVRFFGMSDYIGEGADGHRLVSRLTGNETSVRVRRALVDATYLETSVPATHQPGFEVDPNARLIPPNDLVELTEAASGYTIIGGGKTAMDACGWLLDNGVEPNAIRWIRPRDAWILDRARFQPLELLPGLIEGLSLELEASAEAESIGELFVRLEACGQLIRIDPSVEPTMYRCATLSMSEMESLRRIENVVRHGHVRHIGTDEIVLDQGMISTDRDEVHVDCSATGLRETRGRPIFEPETITLQPVRSCQPSFNSALIGFVEASGRDDADKNRLCPPNPYPTLSTDWIAQTAITQRAYLEWTREPDLTAWFDRCRLDAGRGVSDHMGDPRMQSALHRLMTNVEPAVTNLERFRAPTG